MKFIIKYTILFVLPTFFYVTPSHQIQENKNYDWTVENRNPIWENTIAKIMYESFCIKQFKECPVDYTSATIHTNQSTYFPMLHIKKEYPKITYRNKYIAFKNSSNEMMKFFQRRHIFICDLRVYIIEIQENGYQIYAINDMSIKENGIFNVNLLPIYGPDTSMSAINFPLDLCEFLKKRILNPFKNVINKIRTEDNISHPQRIKEREDNITGKFLTIYRKLFLRLVNSQNIKDIDIQRTPYPIQKNKKRLMPENMTNKQQDVITRKLKITDIQMTPYPIQKNKKRQMPEHMTNKQQDVTRKLIIHD